MMFIRLLGCVTLKAGSIIACCEKMLDNAPLSVVDVILFDINFSQVTVMA